jgi:hypothetical protein
MKKEDFRRPLMQSAVVLATVVILATIAGSSGNGGNGGGIISVIAGIGNFILFIIGLTLGLGVSIALLVGIFLAAVALVSPEQAAIMYSNLKIKCSQGIFICKNSWLCCDTGKSFPPINMERYNRINQDLNNLQEINSALSTKVTGLEEKNLILLKMIEKLETENTVLKASIEEANKTSAQKQPPTTGIFTHIDKEEFRTMFVSKVEEALKQELTYAQIDEFLSSSLPPDLIKIIKNHPSLTKNYIRSIRRD